MQGLYALTWIAVCLTVTYAAYPIPFTRGSSACNPACNPFVRTGPGTREFQRSCAGWCCCAAQWCYAAGDKGASYRGKKTTTQSGWTCQNWENVPRSTGNTPARKPNSGLTSNYCRNPSGATNGPWCYVTGKNVKWETCNIPTCHAGVADDFVKSIANPQLCSVYCCCEKGTSVAGDGWSLVCNGHGHDDNGEFFAGEIFHGALNGRSKFACRVKDVNLEGPDVSSYQVRWRKDNPPWQSRSKTVLEVFKPINEEKKELIAERYANRVSVPVSYSSSTRSTDVSLTLDSLKASDFSGYYELEVRFANRNNQWKNLRLIVKLEQPGRSG